eukprot:snap_masked-scaffold_4-processed-gene-20.17-mRNA-1 protein AED:1.00 eAED:1.00 QI:0/0/0/0/1/1/2/0/96
MMGVRFFLHACNLHSACDWWNFSENDHLWHRISNLGHITKNHNENFEVAELKSGPFDPKSEKTKKEKMQKIENRIENLLENEKGLENSPKSRELEI